MYDKVRVKFLAAQEWEDEVEEALKLIRELVGYAACFKRQSVGMDKLVVGMKCGGSDGLPGSPLILWWDGFPIG